jgi:hypothetical protein
MVYDPEVAKTAETQLRYYYKIVNCGVFCVIAYNLQSYKSIATHMLVQTVQFLNTNMLW